MLNRRTFVSDAKPNAGLGMSAVRRIPNGAPGFANAWVLTLAEIDAVRREALPPHASNRTGMATYLLWWTEITDDVDALIADAEGWCGIED